METFMPIVFTTDFLARSSFDFSRRGGDIRLNKSDNTSLIKQQKANREKLVKSGDPVLAATAAAH